MATLTTKEFIKRAKKKRSKQLYFNFGILIPLLHKSCLERIYSIKELILN